jgi:monooxygenase
VAVEHYDVMVIGAGISGIDAAYHLSTESPDRSFVILEGRADLGGTWDLFRYPGVRSDSDMFTLGFGFKPWNGEKVIADGPSILAYLRETVAEHDIERHIRFNHRAVKAEWATAPSTWTVTTEHGAVFTCNFLFMCSGYYSYREGYTPEFPGRERFAGEIIHPQAWPADFDGHGKEVVVIGSGATAVTLVPALAAEGAHVTMLQRSPTYVVARPNRDRFAEVARKVLPERLAYRITRRLHLSGDQRRYRLIRRYPDKAKEKLLAMARESLGPDFDIDTHFTPTYAPWDQRICLVPDGDLFEALKAGAAEVVTDSIDTFTERGILLASGRELRADTIVTATGLQLVTIGDMDFEVDGSPVDFSSTFTYKGVGYSGVPNMMSIFGYINASWTLRADLVCRYVTRVLNHMSSIGATRCVPTLRPDDQSMAARPWIDNFTSGYMKRSMHMMPKQGDRDPWLNPQTYKGDRAQLVTSPVNDGVLQFS